MIFQFQTGDVTFFDEDREHFEKKLFSLKKFLGSEKGDDDTVTTNVKISKSKHSSGNKFEASATMTSAHHGKFFTEVSADNIKKCADLIVDKLQVQIKKFHEKKLN